MKVQDGDISSQPPALLKGVFHGIDDLQPRTMERDTGDVDGTVRGEVDTFDRSAWSKFDNIPCRYPVADYIEPFLIKAMRLKDLMDLVYVRLVGGEKA